MIPLSGFVKLYVVLVFSLGFLNEVIPFKLFLVLDDVLFALMALILIKVRNKTSPAPGVLAITFPVYIVLGLFIAALSESPAAAIALAARQYKNFFLCFFLFLLNEHTRVFTLKVIRMLLFASIPMCIYQLFTSSSWDGVTGFLGRGASGTLSLLIVFYVVSEFLVRVHEGRKLCGVYLVCLLPIFINETKISFVLIPVAVFIGMLFIGRMRPLQFASLISATVATVFFANYIYSLLYGYLYTDFLTVDSLSGYFLNDIDENGGDLGRFLRVLLAYNYLDSVGFDAILFGQGIGSSFSGEQSEVYGVAASNFMYTTLNEGSRIQLYHSILDFGVLGTFFIVASMITAGVVIFRKRHKDRADIYACVASVVVFVGLFYQPILIGRELSFVYFLFLFSALSNKGKIMV